MKRLLLVSTLLIAFGLMLNAQTIHPKSKSEFKKYVPQNNFVELPGAGAQVPYRGGYTTPLGTAGNLFTIIAGESNMIDYNADINSLVFIHRNDNTVHGGNVGQYRYDVSMDGGKTWDIDRGVLTPSGNTGLTQGRYPQATIHNPAGNTDPDNAHLVYAGTYHNAIFWTGIFSGVEKLDGTGATETITDMQFEPFGGNPSIFSSLVKGKPGTYWNITKHTEQTFSSSMDSVTGFIIGEGTFTGTDVTWSYDTMGIDVNFARDSGGHVYNPQIAFDPTGRYGWIACGADLNGNGITTGVYSPVFWSSTDSGATWGPAQLLDARDYTSVTDWFADTILFDDGMGGVDTVGSAPYIMFGGQDLIVDANGNPHWLAVIGASAWDTGGPFFYYTGIGFNIYDFHHDGTSWDAILVDTLNNFSGDMIGTLTEQNRPNISGTADGNNLFMCWLDTDPGVDATNSFPDCKVKMYNVSTDSWTETFNTTLNTAFESQAYYASISPTAIVNGVGQWTVPTVITEFGVDDGSPTQFHYYESQIGAVVSDFEWEYKLGYGGKVNFYDSSLFTPVTWAWDFDDAGATSASPNPTHTFSADGTYSVCLTVTNSFGSDNSCQDVVVVKVGVEDVALEELVSIAPNPSNGQFTIHLAGLNAADADITLYNVVGSEVTAPMNFSSNAVQMDMSNEASGVYFLKLSVDGQTTTKMISIGTK